MYIKVKMDRKQVIIMCPAVTGFGQNWMKETGADRDPIEKKMEFTEFVPLVTCRLN